jgi:hypothetical protein
LARLSADAFGVRTKEFVTFPQAGIAAPVGLAYFLSAVGVCKPLGDGALLGFGEPTFCDFLDAAADRGLCGLAVGVATGAFDRAGLRRGRKDKRCGQAEAGGEGQAVHDDLSPVGTVKLSKNLTNYSTSEQGVSMGLQRPLVSGMRQRGDRSHLRANPVGSCA